MAAAVFIPPSPHDPFHRMATSTRRAPLANISNATNSPHRLLNNSGSKRSRAVANITQQENEPPLKRQAVDNGDAQPVTPGRRPQPTVAEGKEFERGHGDSMNAFQRKLLATRDKTVQTKSSRTVDHSSREVETIRQWQKHYRKIFPSFRFFFDSVPTELHTRFCRHIKHLGSTEEQFFSKNVTHIITTRSIPAEPVAGKLQDSGDYAEATPIDGQSQTINPSLLERNSNSRNYGQPAATTRRDTSMDIISQGRRMGMKVWPAEKLDRVLKTMMEDPAAQIHHVRNQQTHNGRNQQDLSQVLRNEKIGATTEREQATMPNQIIPFRGPFIYIHDMDEKVRPTMIREYTKPARRQDGDWPQFRSASIGKCPFVEDPLIKKEEQEKQKQKALQAQKQQQQQERDSQRTIQTRSTTETDVMETKMDPPRRTSPRKALQEVRNPVGQAVVPSNVHKLASIKLERQSSFPSMPDQPPLNFMRPSQMHIAGEPAASGIQRSNMTSAIQSQMISSTAATGAKAGTSREVHDLTRKLFERSHTGSLSIGSIPSSRMQELAAIKNARAPPLQRAAKSKAQEKLGGIKEEIDSQEDDIAAERAIHAAKRKKPVKREPKPGYCENCREKYEDFDEHVMSRKHRKFAHTQSNWDELDALLRKLQAP